MSTVKEKEPAPLADGASSEVITKNDDNNLTHPNDTTSGVSCQVRTQIKILEKLREIAKIVKEYNSDADCLDMHFRLKENMCSFWNSHWKEDSEKPLNHTTFNFLEVEDV